MQGDVFKNIENTGKLIFKKVQVILRGIKDKMRNRGRKQKTNDKMVEVSPNISIINLNANGPNTPIKRQIRDFPGGAVVKNPPANAGDTGSIPGPRRSHMLRNN